MTPASSPHLCDVVIVGAARTPIGSFGGALAQVPATELGAIAIKGALENASLPASDVDACYMGNVCSAGIGQAPARQAALRAGLPPSCVCTTVNKVCASGLKSITLAAQDIALGIAQVVVAGGMENMSATPYYLPKARFGYRIGDQSTIDGILCDGLTDSTEDKHMGTFAERCAATHGFSRGAQDDYARMSYRRSLNAWSEGKFAGEVVPVRTIVGRTEVDVDRDEECTRTPIDKIATKRPAFLKDGTGTVTSGNASGLNDGAAAVVLMSRARATQLDIAVLGTVTGFADAERAPADFTIAPALAIPKALKRAGRKMDEVDVFEINEAFAVVALANCKLMELEGGKVNVWGGAVSLGHPIGCSGARIVVTLLSVMRERGGRVGVAGICNGGGGATAMVVEREARVQSRI